MTTWPGLGRRSLPQLQQPQSKAPIASSVMSEGAWGGAVDMRKSDSLPLPIQADDLSETVRSRKTMEQVAIGFDIEEMCGYGGNLLSVLYPLVDWTPVKQGRGAADRAGW
jgi:hypothetical protein